MGKTAAARICAPLILLMVLSAVFGCARISRQCRPAYEDGTYRGIFADGDSIQVNVEFTLEDGKVAEASFRHLRADDNYFLGTGEEPYKSVVSQYEEALEHLVGKAIAGHLDDLYHPEEIVSTRVHGYTAATIRSSKVLSAVRDGLNRGVYRY